MQSMIAFLRCMCRQPCTIVQGNKRSLSIQEVLSKIETMLLSAFKGQLLTRHLVKLGPI